MGANYSNKKSTPKNIEVKNMNKINNPFNRHIKKDS